MLCVKYVVNFHRDDHRLYWCLFFFQAEDGIRDGHVTGVQTCALPIYLRRLTDVWLNYRPTFSAILEITNAEDPDRSEERRVGKSVDLGGRGIIKKKRKKTWKRNDARVRKRDDSR